MIECILWSGAIDTRGYAHAAVGGRIVRIHRWIWEWNSGHKIPQGMHVLHTCDVRHCVNPSHLSIGTHADNMADMRLKGRRKNIGTGGSNGRAKLTQQQVEEIRISPLSQRRAAKTYGIHKSQVQRIRAGKQWRTPIAS